MGEKQIIDSVNPHKKASEGLIWGATLGATGKKIQASVGSLWFKTAILQGAGTVFAQITVFIWVMHGK